MSEVKTYQCMIPSNEPYRHLQATVVLYSDYAAIESKLSAVQAKAYIAMLEMWEG